MKVVMISEKRLDELFNALKSKLAEDPKKTSRPVDDDEYGINYRTFVYHFEGLRQEVKEGGIGL